MAGWLARPGRLPERQTDHFPSHRETSVASLRLLVVLSRNRWSGWAGFSGRFERNAQDAYKTFFTIKETPVRGRKVLFNNEAIQKYRNLYAGFFVILTNDIKDPVETLRVYRNKDAVEKCFDDLKNQLDMKRLRIHSSAAMDGRLFVQFVTLIFMSALRKKMRETGLIEKYTVRELLEEMETLTQVRYSGKYGHILTEVTKPQRQIIEKLRIELHT
jgi:hypothetical protein